MSKEDKNIELKRIKLEIAYEGTNYHGWQIQPNVLTIEGILNETLSTLLKEEIKVIGASRTDAGVHALGNVAVFDTFTRIPPEKICYALNQQLPDDIRVQKSSQVDKAFHPRHCDSKKTYEYYISNRPIELPIERRYMYHYHRELCIDKMREAAKWIEGTHHFKSFCSAKSEVEDTIRTVYTLEILKENQVVTIRVQGSGFLYNMVRIIAGTLIQVGNGTYAPQSIPSMIEAKDRTKAGPSAPAHGLRLIGIQYENE